MPPPLASKPFPALVRPGRAAACERGEQAQYQSQCDKTKPHSEPSFPSCWTVRAPGLMTKYPYVT